MAIIMHQTILTFLLIGFYCQSNQIHAVQLPQRITRPPKSERALFDYVPVQSNDSIMGAIELLTSSPDSTAPSTSAQPSNSSTDTSIVSLPTQPTVAPPDPSKQYVGLIHPTILVASIDPSSCGSSTLNCSIRVATRSRAYNLTYGVKNGIDSVSLESLDRLREPSPGSYDYMNQDSFGITASIYQANYVAEHLDYIKKGNTNGTTMLSLAADKNYACARDVFRAFDRFQHRGRTYFVGIDQANWCFAKFKPGYTHDNKTRSFKDELANIESSVRVHLRMIRQDGGDTAYYKYSALAVVPGSGDDNYVKIYLFDEAGRMSENYFSLKSMEGSKYSVKHYELPQLKTYSLSAIQLNSNSSLKNPSQFDKRITENMIASLKSFDSNSLSKLKEHFDLAFIESILIINGALCWSSGVRIEYHPKVRCMGGKSKWIQYLPPNLLSKQNIHNVYAMEVLEYGGKTYYHFVFNTVTNRESDKYFDYDISTSYWHCTVNQALSPDKPYRWSDFPLLTGNECVLEPYRLNRTALDIVSWKTKSCHKLVTFYNYMYQMNEPNEAITQPGIVQYAPWMKFPVNAVLMRGNKLYFFLSGNTLITYDFKEPSGANDCNMININEQSYKEFLSSELLRDFGHRIQGGLDSFAFNAGPPIYTGYTEYKKDVWRPDIKEWPRTIDSNTAIPGSKDSSATTMFTVIIIVVILLLCCLLYYMFFGNQSPDDELKMRSRKSIGLPVRKSAVKFVGELPGARGVKSTIKSGIKASFPGSSLTVRSMINKSEGAAGAPPPPPPGAASTVGSAATSSALQKTKSKSKSHRDTKKGSTSPGHISVKSAKSVASSLINKTPSSPSNANISGLDKSVKKSKIDKAKGKASKSLKSRGSKSPRSPGVRPKSMSLKKLLKN